VGELEARLDAKSGTGKPASTVKNCIVCGLDFGLGDHEDCKL
jgi:hypothetical protein